MAMRSCADDATNQPADDPAKLSHGLPIPDPEEDDLDDLDDMLDEFSAAKVETPLLASDARVSEGSPSAHPLRDAPCPPDEAFAKELRSQMARLMGNVLDQDALGDLMNELDGVKSDETSMPTHAKATTGDGAFQDTIRKTMERMQASSQQAGPTQTEDGQHLLAQMLSELQGSNGPADGDDGALDKMLLGMMEQLTNKEILYDPMKELHEKFPPWMSTNRRLVGEEDLVRYELQQKLVKEIVQRFERKEYSDSNSEDREFIVDRMQQMQAAGSPPADLVGGMEAAESLSEIESGCAQQ